MSTMDKLLRLLFGLLFFFSITFNTVYIGPRNLGLNTTRVLIIILFIFSIIFIVKQKGVILAPTKAWATTFAIICIWIIYGFCISLAMSFDWEISMRYIWELMTLLVVFLTLSKLMTENENVIVFCMRGFIAGTIVNNIIGWYELFTANYRFVLDITQIPYYAKHNYALSFYANPNNFCSVLVFGCLFCIASLDFETDRHWKIACYATIISSVLLMVRDYSQSNIIGLIVGTVTYYVLKNSKQKKLKIKHLIGLFIVLLCLPEILISLNSFLIQTTDMFFDTESTIGSRLNLSITAINNMLDTNILGVGLGNSKYYSGAIIGNVGNVHNWFTEVLVDTGVFFFVLYIVHYYSILKASLHNSFSESSTLFEAFNRMVFCIMIAFLFFNISSSSLFSSEYIWCQWALCFAVVNRRVKDNQQLMGLSE